MSSREKIMQRLASAEKPFPSAAAPSQRLKVTALANASKEELKARFIQEARALACEVHPIEDDNEAAQLIIEILAGKERILSWDFDHIPCSGLEAALHEAGIETATPSDPRVDFGLTGANAALAATGSLVLVSGAGRERTTALLPQTHIAVISEDQILPNVESWMIKQRAVGLAAFKQSANINIISGPSRTADIAMELILGMHGPRAVHIVIIAA